MPLLLGIDTGGTYTDAVLFDEDAGVVAKAKSLTTRHDLSIGIGGALDAVLEASGASGPDIALTSLSTTLATNALVEGQGGRICLVMIGFPPAALTRAGLDKAMGDDPAIILEGGHDAGGNIAAPLDLKALGTQLEALDRQVTGFAVAGQFAVRNAAHEIAVRDTIRELTGLPVTCSHELSSKLDGPRRALTCVLNARLISMIDHLIEAAETLFERKNINAPLMVVRGDGALISADFAKMKPVETILSGPAASLVGASWLTDVPDAIVSDIGGTTTDVAVLSGGQPRLDTEGAVVGGWRTMVEAVAMRTFGLGGDSEVRLAETGRELILGPRRRVPLSLLAVDHGELVHQTLDQQLSTDRPGDFDGRFAFLLRQSDVHDGRPGNEIEILTALQSGPLPVGRLIKTRPMAATLDRLVANGLVMISSFTPSDAAHVLDLHEGWDKEAARKGADLFARKRTNRLVANDTDGASLARRTVDTLIRNSAETLLESALAEDGFKGEGLSRHQLAVAAIEGSTGLVHFDMKINVPVIGLGASAPTYYPAVAAMLKTSALVPEHAGVANAIGAVVGRVRIAVEATVVQPQPGLFRVHAAGSQKDFTNLDPAITFAEETIAAAAASQAVAAGADNVKVKMAREDKRATIEGQDTLIEAKLTATASGRPRIAA